MTAELPASIALIIDPDTKDPGATLEGGRKLWRNFVASCRAASLAIIALLSVACGAPEVLEPRPGNVPAGVELSGTWTIRTNAREDERRLREAIRKTDGIKDDDLFRRPDRQSTDMRGRSSRGVKGGLVYVFLETGALLKLTQTEHALFISFDRAVVQEFRFGEARMVSLGEVVAQRVTGWDGEHLVIDTLDKNRMKMTERYRLIEGGKVLERTITLRSKEGEAETVVQEFEKQDG